MRQIAITDIHGCVKTFQALLDQVGLTTSDQLYLLGDYIDRGPDSKGVIDLLLEMQSTGYQLHCLLGNHEQMLLEMADPEQRRPLNLYPGLIETLLSYDCRHPREIPEEHRAFLNSLPYYLEVDDYLLVHAGLNFSATDPMQDREAMLWHRHWYNNINRDWLGERIILHGHTPVTVEDILRMYDGLEELPVLNLDNGCVFDAPGMNQLTAFDMTNRELHFQKNIDR